MNRIVRATFTDIVFRVYNNPKRGTPDVFCVDVTSRVPCKLQGRYAYGDWGMVASLWESLVEEMGERVAIGYVNQWQDLPGQPRVRELLEEAFMGQPA